MYSQLKVFIFDMDGVITDTMPYHFKAWKYVFALSSINVTHEDIYKREGQKGIDSVREIFKEKNVSFSENLAKKLLKEKEIHFKTIFKRRFILGSRSFIKVLSNKNYRLALVTGTSRHEAEELLPEDLWNSFEIKVCGSDVQNGKPHPEPYLSALSRLKVSAKNAMVIENAPFGIASAKAAGLKCFALETSLPKKYLKQADAVFSSYKDLRNEISI
jgi:beta-phosphoglucomutase